MTKIRPKLFRIPRKERKKFSTNFAGHLVLDFKVHALKARLGWKTFCQEQKKRKKMCMKNRHQTQKKFWIKKVCAWGWSKRTEKKLWNKKCTRKKEQLEQKERKSHTISQITNICIYAAFLFAFVMFWSPSNMSLKASLRHDHSNRRQKFYFKRKNGFNRLKTMDVIRKMNHKI